MSRLLRSLLKYFCLGLILFYRYFISPLKQLVLGIPGQCCRFSPTCSEYTYRCIQQKGLLKGLYLGMRQFVRCHPFCLKTSNK